MSFREFFRGGGGPATATASASAPSMDILRRTKDKDKEDLPPPTSSISVPIKSSRRSSGGIISLQQPQQRPLGPARSRSTGARMTTSAPATPAVTPMTAPAPITATTAHRRSYTSSLLLQRRQEKEKAPSTSSPQRKKKGGKGGAEQEGKTAAVSSTGSVLVLHGKVHNYVSDSSSLSMAEGSNEGSEDSLEQVMGYVAPNHSSSNPNSIQSKSSSNKNNGRSSGTPTQQQQQMQQQQPHWASATTSYPPIPLAATSSMPQLSYPRYHTPAQRHVSATLHQLAIELQHFQALISDLQGMMLLGGGGHEVSVPEAGWRTRILVRSAQEADNDLWRKLYEAEQLVLAMRNDADYSTATTDNVRLAVVQEAQSRCLELHHHFKHLHKTLLATLEAHEQAQRATVAQQLHTAAVLMMNPATAGAGGAAAAGAGAPGPSPSGLLATPTRSLLLMNGPGGNGGGGMDLTAYSPSGRPLSPAFGMTPTYPPMATHQHGYGAAPMMMQGTPLGPPPPQQYQQQQQPPMDYFDRVTHQAEIDRAQHPAAFEQAAISRAGCLAPTQGEPGPTASSDGAPPPLWASRHCAEDGAMSSFGQYVNKAAPGLCGSLETLGDPRLWNFGGIEALDLVYKGSDMELSKGSAVHRPAPAPLAAPTKDKDDDSVEMISPESEAIEVERILTEERDVVGATPSGGIGSRVPSLVKSFTDASVVSVVSAVKKGRAATPSCGPGGACSGGDDAGKVLGCGCGTKRADDQEKVEGDAQGDSSTDPLLNCGALQAVDLDEIHRNLVQFGRDVMSGGGDRGGAGADHTHEDGNAGCGADHEDYDGDEDYEDEEDEDDDDYDMTSREA